MHQSATLNLLCGSDIVVHRGQKKNIAGHDQLVSEQSIKYKWLVLNHPLVTDNLFHGVHQFSLLQNYSSAEYL